MVKDQISEDQDTIDAAYREAMREVEYDFWVELLIWCALLMTIAHILHIVLD